MSASHNPWHGLLHAVAERLIPLFQTEGQSREYARSAALEAISAYRPESRADYASIGRVLALSLAAIAAIGNAADPELLPDLQLRFLTKANTLSRSAEQAERGMNQRRHQRSAEPETENYLLAPPDPEAQPPETPEPTDEAILTQVESAVADFRALVPESPTAKRPPCAAMLAGTLPQSFRQDLRNHVPIGLVHPTT